MINWNGLTWTRSGPMIYHRLDVYVGRSLDRYGEFSTGETRLFNDLLKPGDSVIDGGANVGALTIPLARMVGPTGFVLAVEPQYATFLVLAGNVALNSMDQRVQVVNVALGAKEGAARFPMVDLTKPTNAGGVEMLPQESDEGETYAVHLTTIDSFSAVLGRLDLIKLDIEGSELEALHGTIETIERFRPLLYVEADRPAVQEPLVDFLRDNLGYETFEHKPPLYNPDNYRGDPENVFPGIVSYNILAIPEARVGGIVNEDFRARHQLNDIPANTRGSR